MCQVTRSPAPHSLPPLPFKGLLQEQKIKHGCDKKSGDHTVLIRLPALTFSIYHWLGSPPCHEWDSTMPTWATSSFYLLIVWNNKCDELRILSTGILSPSGALNISFSWSLLQREIKSPFPFTSLWSAIFQDKYSSEYKTKQQLCELQKWWGPGEFCPWALCRLVLTVSPDTQSFML